LRQGKGPLQRGRISDGSQSAGHPAATLWLTQHTRPTTLAPNLRGHAARICRNSACIRRDNTTDIFRQASESHGGA
jgi:hypothetical protein